MPHTRRRTLALVLGPVAVIALGLGLCSALTPAPSASAAHHTKGPTMVLPNLSSDYDLAKRLTAMEQNIANLNTRDVLKNATFGPDGTTVAQAFAKINDAIAATVLPETGSNSATNLAYTTTPTVATSVSFTVPAGYTTAQVIGNSTAMGYNSGSVADYLYAQTVIHGVSGGEMYAEANPGIAAGVTAPYYTTFSGLKAGWTITVSAQVRTSDHTWAASASNVVDVYASVLFLR